MNERLRRILFIIAFVLVVVGMFWLIYFIFFRSSPVTNGNTNTANVNGLPPLANGNVNRTPGANVNSVPVVNTNPDRYANGGPTVVEPVIPTPTAGATVTSGGDLSYYDRPTGKFFKIGADGVSKIALTDAVYREVETVTWNRDGDKAVLTFPDDSKIMYDFAAKKQVTLPRELNEFMFSPNGDQLVSKYLDGKDPDNQWLMVTNADGTNAQSVEQLGENARKVTSSWSPNNTVVATYEKSVTGSTTEIIFLGKNNENLPSAEVDGRGFIPNWTPDGSRILYSVYNEFTDNAHHLYIMDGSPDNLGRNIIDLGLDTRADKCTFSQDNYTVYCAVPYYPVTDSGPVPSLGYSVPDNIYKIDLLRGSTELIASPVDDSRRRRFSIGTMHLNLEESVLYFTDVQTGYVNRILLP